VVAALFLLLWLSEILPDLLAGAPSRSAGDRNVPTNPVHVLDLAFFLPAVITTGPMLLVATLAVLVGLLRQTAASPGLREDQAR
jgi:hypothetical protein